MTNQPRRGTEHLRLVSRDAGEADWYLWGPYLSDRAWGTVREDYSADGEAWQSFPHDHARSRAYRWNEDGLAGISDANQYLCFALGLWNGRDAIIKERLFGLTGPEGNHGEDVKEEYFHLDATPSHSYLEMLYRYPHGRFPYRDLVDENRRRAVAEPEYDLADTGILDDKRYFDVRVAYAKAAPDDILITIAVTNQGTTSAACHVLPTMWFRNTWSWGYPAGPRGDVATEPRLSRVDTSTVRADHPVLGTYDLIAAGEPDIWFTNNETNRRRLWSADNRSEHVKDAFHNKLIEGDPTAINAREEGTKAAMVYQLTIKPGATETIRLRLSADPSQRPFEDFDATVEQRRSEADEFFLELAPPNLTLEEKSIHRRALAGMIWSKQLYYYDIEQWQDGDPAFPPPRHGQRLWRNGQWRHLNTFDIISMPDSWEYPWFAAWDLAFHCLPLARMDPSFAKSQLELMTREWYMHPNGQIPAYEWSFDDANPPVHAWATRRVYEMDAAVSGIADTGFLERVFHKLLLNFTWWVNRKDADGNNVFQGGFLGLDNISVFDRSAPLPGGGELDQSDGTAWMAFFTLEMLAISLELAETNPVYQSLATKFFEHFLSIASAMSSAEHSLWDTTDGFFYDVLRMPDGRSVPLRVRSLIGLIPLLAGTVIDEHTMNDMPGFLERMHWFLEHRPHLAGNIASIDDTGRGHRHLAGILTRERLESVLRYMLDEEEFLSPYGIRSLSRHHRDHPYALTVGGETFRVSYEPGESGSNMFGGNSNWRGPIWFPVNFLIIEALERFHEYYGEDFTVECPTGSGQRMTLGAVAGEISRRLTSLFLTDDSGRRPFHDPAFRLQDDENWAELFLFHEYFHGDDGTGLGASHQTGWTGLVAELMARRHPPTA